MNGVRCRLTYYLLNVSVAFSLTQEWLQKYQVYKYAKYVKCVDNWKKWYTKCNFIQTVGNLNI